MSIHKKIKEESRAIREAVREKTLGYILTALGLVVGLSWNEAIKSSIEYFFPAANENTLFAKFYYASFLTLILVIFSVYLNRIFKKNEKDEKNDSKK
jgi:hypothetical protein